MQKTDSFYNYSVMTHQTQQLSKHRRFNETMQKLQNLQKQLYVAEEKILAEVSEKQAQVKERQHQQLSKEFIMSYHHIIDQLSLSYEFIQDYQNILQPLITQLQMTTVEKMGSSYNYKIFQELQSQLNKLANAIDEQQLLEHRYSFNHNSLEALIQAEKDGNVNQQYMLNDSQEQLKKYEQKLQEVNKNIEDVYARIKSDSEKFTLFQELVDRVNNICPNFRQWIHDFLNNKNQIYILTQLINNLQDLLIEQQLNIKQAQKENADEVPEDQYISSNIYNPNFSNTSLLSIQNRSMQSAMLTNNISLFTGAAQPDFIQGPQTDEEYEQLLAQHANIPNYQKKLLHAYVMVFYKQENVKLIRCLNMISDLIQQDENSIAMLQTAIQNHQKRQDSQLSMAHFDEINANIDNGVYKNVLLQFLWQIFSRQQAFHYQNLQKLIKYLSTMPMCVDFGQFSGMIANTILSKLDGLRNSMVNANVQIQQNIGREIVTVLKNAPKNLEIQLLNFDMIQFINSLFLESSVENVQGVKLETKINQFTTLYEEVHSFENEKIKITNKINQCKQEINNYIVLTQQQLENKIDLLESQYQQYLEYMEIKTTLQNQLGQIGVNQHLSDEIRQITNKERYIQFLKDVYELKCLYNKIGHELTQQRANLELFKNDMQILQYNPNTQKHNSLLDLTFNTQDQYQTKQSINPLSSNDSFSIENNQTVINIEQQENVEVWNRRNSGDTKTSMHEEQNSNIISPKDFTFLTFNEPGHTLEGSNGSLQIQDITSYDFNAATQDIQVTIQIINNYVIKFFSNYKYQVENYIRDQLNGLQQQRDFIVLKAKNALIQARMQSELDKDIEKLTKQLEKARVDPRYELRNIQYVFSPVNGLSEVAAKGREFVQSDYPNTISQFLTELGNQQFLTNEDAATLQETLTDQANQRLQDLFKEYCFKMQEIKQQYFDQKDNTVESVSQNQLLQLQRFTLTLKTQETQGRLHKQRLFDGQDEEAITRLIVKIPQSLHYKNTQQKKMLRTVFEACVNGFRVQYVTGDLKTRYPSFARLNNDLRRLCITDKSNRHVPYCIDKIHQINNLVPRGKDMSPTTTIRIEYSQAKAYFLEFESEQSRLYMETALGTVLRFYKKIELLQIIVFEDLSEKSPQ